MPTLLGVKLRLIVFHGVPTAIHSDQGREFEGHVFQRLAELLGAHKTRTAPYRPQSDGFWNVSTGRF